MDEAKDTKQPQQQEQQEQQQIEQPQNEQVVIFEAADGSAATPALVDHGYDNSAPADAAGAAPVVFRAIPKKPEPYKWSEDDIRTFLHLRRKYINKFHTGKRGSIQKTYGEIIEEMGLVGLVSPVQARKKWNNMAQLYRRLVSHPQVDVVTGQEIPPAISWPFFQDMQKTIELEPNMDPDECQVFEATSLEDLRLFSCEQINSHIIQLAGAPSQDTETDSSRASDGPRPPKRPKRDKERLYSMIRELGRLNQKQEAILSAKNKLTIRLLNQLV